MISGAQIAGGNSEYGRSAQDFYPTPPEPTIALLDFLRIPKTCTIWEPACGEGDMVNVIRNMGYNCIGTDINTGTDFLNCDCPKEAGAIVTNPPFCLADQFISRCSQTGLPFALLLKTQYFQAQKRYSLFFDKPPAFILPLCWRVDFLQKKRGEKGSPPMDVMWAVWMPCSKATQYIPLRKPKIEEEVEK